MHGGTRHGGQRRAAGRGSEFTVRLPADPVADLDGDADPADVRAERPPAAQPRRILVVDDNRDAAESLAVLLRLLGHHVEAVNEGPAALRAATALRPDVVFLDLGMPGMSGFEVARRLRERRDVAGAELVALTGWGTDTDRRRSLDAGFDHHFVKPVEPDDLLDFLDGLDGLDGSIRSANRGDGGYPQPIP